MTDQVKAIWDAICREHKEERVRTQMTLGEAIQALEAMPQDIPVSGLEPLGSYRGYYEDLAFGSHGERTHDKRGLFPEINWNTLKAVPNTEAPPEAIIPCPGPYRTVADVLADCRSALGACFCGYKGGDFWMTGETPLWVSGYGSASEMRVMELVVEDGVLVAKTDAEE